LLLSLTKFLIDGALFALHTLLLVLEIADVKLNTFFMIVKHETAVTETLNLVNFGFFAELGVEVIIVVVIILFFNFFFFSFFSIIVTLSFVLLDFLRSATLFGDFLIEGQDLVIVFVVSIDEVMELS